MATGLPGSSEVKASASNAGDLGSIPGSPICPWNSPGKNTGVGSHSLLQPFPSHSPGIEPESLALQADSFYRNHLSHQGRGTMSRPFHVLSYLILRTAHDLGILLLSQIKELVHRKIKYLVQGQTDTSDRAKT